MIGVEHGAFNPDGYICLQDNVYRICAPNPADTKEMTACIFWTKISSTDTSPTWDKVVSIYLSYIYKFIVTNNMQFGAVVYNLEQLDTTFNQDNDQIVDYIKATIANVKYVL